MRNFKIPKTVLLVKESVVETPIGSSFDQTISFVKKSFLEEYSQLDMQAVYTITRADGELAFRGKIRDMFRLAGVEETHHGIFEQLKAVTLGINPLAVTVAEYDAREIEYRALKWQLRCDLEQNMPFVTIQKLQERLAAAIQIRATL